MEIKTRENIEMSIKKEKKVEYLFDKSIQPYNGHTLWEINVDTLDIDKAEFEDVNTTYVYNGNNPVQKKLIKRKGFVYVSALNMRNAIKKFSKGLDGGKVFLEDLYYF